MEERKDARKLATPPSTNRQGVTVERKIRPAPIKVKKDERQLKANQEGSSDSSGDEYVANKDIKGKGRAKAKVRLMLRYESSVLTFSMQRRTVTTDSDTASDGETKSKGVSSPTTRKLRRPSTATERAHTVSVSASPEPDRASRRRKSTSTITQPPPKRKRTDTISSQTQSTPGGGEDAARKYCLSKLLEIFRDIFLRYPVLHNDAATNDHEKEEHVVVVADKSLEELTDEEKETLRERAKRFTSELEECMYELYSEPDKFGKHSVAAKYK